MRNFLNKLNKKIMFSISVLILVFLIIGIQLVFGNNNSIEKKQDKKIKILSEVFRNGKKDSSKIDKVDSETETLKDIENKKEDIILSEEKDKNLENTNKKEDVSVNYGNTERNVTEKNSKTNIKQETVKISIVCVNDSISSEKDIPIEQGQTVFEVLKKLTRKENIQMDFSGIGNNIYVKGIANVYEFDKGPESGWMYRVNGVFPNKSCGGFTVTSGDKIEWLYTKDLGKDIGNGY